MTAMASQTTSLVIVYSTVYSGAYWSKHQSSASLAFVRGIHRGPVNSPHKWPVTRIMFPFDDVIMNQCQTTSCNPHSPSAWIRITLQWRHNGPDGVSNHQPYDCLLSRLFRRRSKKTSSASLAFLRGIHWWPVNSPHEGPVTRKMFPFDDVIMSSDMSKVSGNGGNRSEFKVLSRLGGPWLP